MDNCINSTYYKNKNGHTQIRYMGKKVPHHRVVYCLANNIDLQAISGLVVRHKCDNPSCVNPGHLELGTQQDNVNDRESRGRGADHVGAAHPRTKFTDDDIKYIRATNLNNKLLAEKYGVSVSTIVKIIAKINWKHI